MLDVHSHLDELCTSDVLRHTLLPKLALADLLSLEQSCRALRSMLSREEPWRNALGTYLPPDHPLPSLSASERGAAHTYAVMQRAYGAGNPPITYAYRQLTMNLRGRARAGASVITVIHCRTMEFRINAALHVSVPPCGDLFAVYTLHKDGNDSEVSDWRVCLFQISRASPLQRLQRQYPPCPYSPHASWSPDAQHIMLSYLEDDTDPDEDIPYQDCIQVICMSRHATAHRVVCLLAIWCPNHLLLLVAFPARIPAAGMPLLFMCWAMLTVLSTAV